MHTSDQVILWQWGVVTLNQTIVTTWGVMLLLVVGAWFVTRRLPGPASASSPACHSTWQAALEAVLQLILNQLAGTGLRRPEQHIGFLGTLFLFIALSNLSSLLPFTAAPTGSLSTTVALALCVFVAVPAKGIAERGVLGYLRHFFHPTFLMFPFHVMGEISRTVALAVRLFGNVMSEEMIGGILLLVAPLVFPILLKLFGLLTGLVQAYIFTILATVFIAAATGDSESPENGSAPPASGGPSR